MLFAHVPPLCGGRENTMKKEVFIKKEVFGTLENGGAVHKYTLKNEECELVLMDYGASIVSWRIGDTDVVGGFDTLSDYLRDTAHQGATIGRVANRIEGARFEMDGKTYLLPDNDGGNCLHGGDGFDHRLWSVTHFDEGSVRFEYLSADGEEGFPAALAVAVTYSLNGTELVIDYRATPTGKTPIALTNHSYFNLEGFGGDVMEHRVTIYAESYSAVNDKLIPTGEHPSVRGTALDFTAAHRIGERIGETKDGYDHNFLLAPTCFEVFSGKELGLAAVVCGEGLKMSVYTDQPAIQLYTGNFLGGEIPFKGGVKQVRHGALCLEAQTEPNCINHGVGFYEAGEEYIQTTVYRIERL